MVKCPNCGTKISFRKAFFGRLSKKGCACCGTRLATTRTYGAMVGGIGGGTGTFMFTNLYKSNFSIYNIIITIVWFILLIICSYVFAKYKVID